MICVNCKPDPEAMSVTVSMEDAWQERPVEVQEVRCEACEVWRKWWWFAPLLQRAGFAGNTSNTSNADHEAPGMGSRLGRVTQAMLNDFRSNPEALEGDCVVILASDGASTSAGIRYFNLDNDADAASYILAHLRELCAQNGIALHVYEMPERGNPRDN